ncbi:MAG: hypothetical protein MUE40_08155 [Anaerolineae bacterium]|jgi:hypothetical protein|nr:hypothetical protein [Anaerolineae bacterium]
MSDALPPRIASTVRLPATPEEQAVFMQQVARRVWDLWQQDLRRERERRGKTSGR